MTGIIKHSQSTQSNNFAISLQYLRKEVRNEVHFLHEDKHQSFYKLALLFLMEMGRHVRTTQNKELVIFLQYIKEKVLQLLLRSVVMQNTQIFHRGPVVFGVTCFLVVVVKNGRSFLDHGTRYLIYIYIYIYIEWIDEMCWFFACLYKFRTGKC